jgi:hypothetical protein
LNGSLRPGGLRMIHHVMVKPVRVLQERKLASSLKKPSPPPYLLLQLADGEEGIGDFFTLLRLDRMVIRERGGVSRHLEKVGVSLQHQRR